MGVTFNPFTDNLDFIKNAGLYEQSDPANPATNQAWIRYQGGVYSFSYQTSEGSIKRLTLS